MIDRHHPRDQASAGPWLCFGPHRFVLKFAGVDRWISRGIIGQSGLVFTDVEAEALRFSTPLEARNFWRHVSPFWPLDEDGCINRPLAHLELEISELTS